MLVPAKDYRDVMRWRFTNPAAKAWWNDFVRSPLRERSGGLCERCGRLERVVRRGGKRYVRYHDIHHLTYRNLFSEHRHLEDLRYLCRFPCHALADRERRREKSRK